MCVCVVNKEPHSFPLVGLPSLPFPLIACQAIPHRLVVLAERPPTYTRPHVVRTLEMVADPLLVLTVPDAQRGHIEESCVCVCVCVCVWIKISCYDVTTALHHAPVPWSSLSFTLQVSIFISVSPSSPTSRFSLPSLSLSLRLSVPFHKWAHCLHEWIQHVPLVHFVPAPHGSNRS